MNDNEFSKTKSTKARILATIRHFGTISIKNISNYCNLSIPLVTQHVELMLKDNLLTEQTTSVSSVGRKPKLFSLNAGYGYIIGVELGLLHTIKIGLFSFDGVFVANSSIKYTPQCAANKVVESMIKTIEALLHFHAIDKEKIRHIVMGNPGIVNPETGTMELAAQFASWRALPLRHIFMEHFNTLVEVLNDVNLSAIGEKEFGIGRGYNNFILIRQSVGLKAGIILKNRLYQGESKAAGEIGNSMISVMEDGNMVYEKAEKFLSMAAICEHIATRLNDNPNDIFYTVTGGDPQNVTPDTIAKVLGTPSFVNEHIAKAGEMFGYVLTNVVSALDLDLIILCGDVVKFNNYYLKAVRDVLTECLIYPPTVLTSALGDDVALHGAYAVGLERTLDKIP